MIDSAGGVAAAAAVCGVTPRAVYKWLSNERLPRTDYTGETQYAEALSMAAGGLVTPEEIRSSGIKHNA